MMESITWSRDIIRRIAICVVLLTSLYGITESHVEECFQQNDMGENCTCSSPPPMLPERPLFCKCFVGELPDNLMSINGSCETNATVPSSTICTFECEEGYTLSHNETIQCMGGQFSHPIPSCNETDECLSDPCMNNGTCTDFLNSYDCTCVPGYEGLNCEIVSTTTASTTESITTTPLTTTQAESTTTAASPSTFTPITTMTIADDISTSQETATTNTFQTTTESDANTSDKTYTTEREMTTAQSSTVSPTSETILTTTATTSGGISTTGIDITTAPSPTIFTTSEQSTTTVAEAVTTIQTLTESVATTSGGIRTTEIDATTAPSPNIFTTSEQSTTTVAEAVTTTAQTSTESDVTTSGGIRTTEIDATTAPSPNIFTTSEQSTTTVAEADTTTAQTSTESDGTMSGGIGTTDIQMTTTPSLPFHTTSESSIATTVDQSTITPQTSPESVARTSGEPGTTEEAISTTLETVTAPSVSQSILTTDGLTTIQSEPMTEPTTTISSPATLTTTTPTTTTTSAPTSQSETMSTSSSNSPSSPTVTVSSTTTLTTTDTSILTFTTGTTTTASTSQSETMSTSTSSPTSSSSSSPTETYCTLPDDVIVNSSDECQPEYTVVSGTSCTFGCNNIGKTITSNCTAEGTWEPEATCGNYACRSNVRPNNTAQRKRRDVLPSDNAAVLIVEETFELTIQGLDTTYLVNATTVSAQNSTNDILQMSLLFGIMYTSAISVDELIIQVEEALLAVDEFTVISVDVSDLDALCSPNPCENDAGCTVDYNNLNFTCSCAVGYSGRLCSDSSSVLLIAILVPTVTLIVAFTVFTIVLVVYYRVRLHQLKGYKRSSHRNMAMESANGYHGDLKQLYFTEDKTPGYHDQGTLKNSTLGLRFSKEINARMQERSRSIELQALYPQAYYIGPADRHPHQTDHIRNGRSLSNGDQALQTFHPNGIHSRDKASQGHMVDSSSVEYNYAAITNQSKTRRHSSRDNHRNRTTSTSQGISYNRRRTRDDLDGRNRALLERTRNGGIPRSMHVETEFNDTRL